MTNQLLFILMIIKKFFVSNESCCQNCEKYWTREYIAFPSPFESFLNQMEPFPNQLKSFQIISKHFQIKCNPSQIK